MVSPVAGSISYQAVVSVPSMATSASGTITILPWPTAVVIRAFASAEIARRSSAARFAAEMLVTPMPWAWAISKDRDRAVDLCGLAVDRRGYRLLDVPLHHALVDAPRQVERNRRLGILPRCGHHPHRVGPQVDRGDLVDALSRRAGDQLVGDQDQPRLGEVSHDRVQRGDLRGVEVRERLEVVGDQRVLGDVVARQQRGNGGRAFRPPAAPGAPSVLLERLQELDPGVRVGQAGQRVQSVGIELVESGGATDQRRLRRSAVLPDGVANPVEQRPLVDDARAPGLPRLIVRKSPVKTWLPNGKLVSTSWYGVPSTTSLLPGLVDAVSPRDV